MKEFSVCLHRRGAHILERTSEGKWLLDKNEITTEEAIAELVVAVQDLGYWCQVSKDILPQECFEMVQEAYAYED
ncbi:hypothetical protein Goe25_00240 [Bacillus phage vB_BsuM-Goe25]|nr:hypothetical protein Goe25_00240 [Bacillus phage vB_BsuM-Goe25]